MPRRLVAALTIALTLTFSGLPAVAQQQPQPDPLDLRAIAERRRAAAADQLEQAQTFLDHLDALRRSSRETADDDNIDLAERAVAATRAELAEELIGYERVRVSVAAAAAEVAKLAEAAVDARLLSNDSGDPLDRQAARDAEQAAIAAAEQALDLAKRQLGETAAAARTETALVMLDQAGENLRQPDVVELNRSLAEDWAKAARAAVERAAAAVRTTFQAWRAGLENRARRPRRPDRARAKGKDKRPRPGWAGRIRPRKPKEDEPPPEDQLSQRAAALREITATLDQVAKTLTADAAKAHEEEPERFPSLLTAALFARRGATQAKQEAEATEAKLAELAGEGTEGDGGGEEAPAEPAEADAGKDEKQPADEGGDGVASALLSADHLLDPGSATPEPPPAPPPGKAGAGTVEREAPDEVTQPGVEGMEVLPPAPTGPATVPAAAPDERTSSWSASTTPATPPGIKLPAPDQGIDGTPGGWKPDVPVLDPPQPTVEAPVLDLPPLIGPEVPVDIEGGGLFGPWRKPGVEPGLEPDHGIQFGPAAPDIPQLDPFPKPLAPEPDLNLLAG